MEKRKLPHTTRICDDGLALDEPRPTATAATTGTGPFRSDDWAARQRVRTVVRELRRPNPAAIGSTNRIASDRLRFDPPQDLFGQIEHASAPGLAPTTSSPIGTNLHGSSSGGSQLFAWFVVIVGILALGSGVGLIAWSLSTKQMQHWNLALGLATGGQGALILGLVLVISRLWRSSRYAATKLQDVYARLGHVQQAAESLAASRSAGAPAFYADLVRGASPHVLLANLKGQVDQLATRVGSG